MEPSSTGPAAGKIAGEAAREVGGAAAGEARGALAAIDCGTLSTRLLVCSPGGATLERLTWITGLGQGVDGSRELRPQAMQSVLAVLAEYRQVMRTCGVTRAAMVGTSALRDAANRGTFLKAAQDIVGAPLQLLPGREEALLSYAGATAGLPPDSGPWLVVDIGGGSTELVVGPAPLSAVSMDLGCVRVKERFFAHDPATAAEMAAARSWLIGELTGAAAELVTVPEPATLVGLAGTVSALACLDQRLEHYSREAVHHYRLGRAAVDRALATLAGMPEAARAVLPGIEPARAPFITAGTLVLSTLMSYFGFDECLVSEQDILDGLVLRLAGSSQGALGAM